MVGEGFVYVRSDATQSTQPTDSSFQIYTTHGGNDTSSTTVVVREERLSAQTADSLYFPETDDETQWVTIRAEHYDECPRAERLPKRVKEPPPWTLIAALRSPHRGLRLQAPRDARRQVWDCRPRHGLD